MHKIIFKLYKNCHFTDIKYRGIISQKGEFYMFNITLKKKLKQGEIIPLNMDFMFTNIFNKEENIDILEH